MKWWPRRSGSPGVIWPTSVDRASDAVRDLGAGLCISIADPDRRASSDRHLEGVLCTVLRLDIHDIERPAPDCVMPTVGHMDQVLLAVRILSLAVPVVVHCQAGISRSAAVALCVATDRWQRAGHPPAAAVERAFEQVLHVAPHVRPNVAMMSMAIPLLRVDASDWMARTWSLHR